jgi:hypothetical protein
MIFVYNIFTLFNVYSKNEKKNTSEKIKNTNLKFLYYFETFFVKPIFCIICYILLIVMLLLFSIVKIIKYITELLMDFIDSDETKLYNRFCNNK